MIVLRGRLALVVMIIVVVVGHGWDHPESSASGASKRKPVWVVFFYSKGCPNCEPVGEFLDVLKKSYPVRLKSFDIDNPEHYGLYQRLEEIHARGAFAVPLVMVGESILIGEREISTRLEKIVRNLSRSGGASLPYLGSDPSPVPTQSPSANRDAEGAPCEDCERKGRPPTIQEEWKKIKDLVNKYL